MSSPTTATQVSAGGVAFRQREGQIEIALILVGPKQRWQLPKGAINPDELIEEAAQREVQEEAGIATDMIEQLDKIEYWFYITRKGQRIRYHKFVHFYLLRYRSGNVDDHDHEVEEARWVEIGKAITLLAFDSEKEVVRKARDRITSMMISGEPIEGNGSS